MIEFFEQVSGRADHLIVAFTGVLQRMGGIPFEFHESLGAGGTNVLFVRDTGQRWYQYDMETIEYALSRIKEMTATTGANRMSCIGNSMGGFGALLFGSLCAADAILAFAPQTTILPQQTSAMGDGRWLQYQANIETYTLADLNALLPATGRVTIYRGADDTLDAAHVARLEWSNECVVRANCGHDVARSLKDKGELSGSIRSAIFD